MKYLYQNKHWELNKEYNLNKLLYLMVDRPSRITVFDEFIWENKRKQLHRDYDLPALCNYFLSVHYVCMVDGKPTRVFYGGEVKEK